MNSDAKILMYASLGAVGALGVVLGCVFLLPKVFKEKERKADGQALVDPLNGAQPAQGAGLQQPVDPPPQQPADWDEDFFSEPPERTWGQWVSDTTSSLSNGARKVLGGVVGIVVLIIAVLIGFCIVFLPWVVAIRNGHINSTPILIMVLIPLVASVLMFPTVLGAVVGAVNYGFWWFLALVWSFRRDGEKRYV